jgi:ubiquinone/menaquinone biosynthesis C-methylase UbiE
VADKFDPKHAHKLENPDRLLELPPARLVELLRLTGAETVVDFGAGTGMYSMPLAASVPQGRVYAVDEQDEILARLRAKLAAQPSITNVVPVASDEHGRAPLDDGAAQAMLVVNVLHHVEDDPRALPEMYRLLAPGGRLVVAEFAQMDRPVGPSNDHVLPLGTVRALLAGAGFTELEVHAPGAVGMYHNVIVAEKPQP